MHFPKLCHLILEELLRAQDQVIVDVDTYHTDKFLRGRIAEKKKRAGHNFDFSAPSNERIVSRCASLSPYTLSLPSRSCLLVCNPNRVRVLPEIRLSAHGNKLACQHPNIVRSEMPSPRLPAPNANLTRRPSSAILWQLPAVKVGASVFNEPLRSCLSRYPGRTPLLFAMGGCS